MSAKQNAARDKFLAMIAAKKKGAKKGAVKGKKGMADTLKKLAELKKGKK